MVNFVSGLITAGFLVSALFFAKFWRRSRDPLFAIFSAAFTLLALNQASASLLDLPEEEQSWTYLLRLAAFVLIAFAIIQKNTGTRSRW